MPTDDLHARLVAAVQERKRTAEALDFWNFVDHRAAGWACYECGGLEDEEVAHIAANDPATIIRHCEADLRRLERHAETGGVCPQCAADQRVVDDAEDGKTYWEFRPIDWPCDEIRDLAAAYGVEVDGG